MRVSAPGRMVGRYRIVSKLGQGGMGAVWKAVDTRLHRTVALKLLPESLAASQEARIRLLREARNAANLDHSGIATVFDADQVDGRLYIAYKLVDGETVSDRVARGTLSLAEAITIAIQAGQALGHAHQRGTLHRDVSGGNIMITSDGRAMIVDFGLALPEDGSRVTEPGTVMGTKGYMAPEMLLGQMVDRRSDVYGLSAVLYQMLAGRLPIEAPTWDAMYPKILNEVPRPPSDWRHGIPGELDRIVLKGLAKSPEDRYQDTDAMIADLTALMDSGAAAAFDAQEIPKRTGRWQWFEAQRRRLRRALTRPMTYRQRTAAAGAVVAAFVVIAALLIWKWDALTGGGVPAFSSVAVLPPTNESEDLETSSWFSGVGEHLVTQLSQLEGIRVSPWQTTKSMAYSRRPYKEVARELGVSALVIGTFREREGLIHVQLGIVNGRDGLQDWAQEFEEPVERLFELQRDMALAVAGHLRGRLSETERVAIVPDASRSADAYVFYLRGAEAQQEDDPVSNDFALSMYERAIKLDPYLAEAYVGVGSICSDRYFRGGEGGRAALEEAERNFRHALTLDPDLGGAQRGLITTFWERGERESCLVIGRNAAARGPGDVDALLVRSWAYVVSYLADKAVPLLDRVLELDPANETAYLYRVIATTWAGEYAEALKSARAFENKFGEDPEVLCWQAVALHTLGNQSEASETFERSIALFQNNSNLYVNAWAAAHYLEVGDTLRAHEILAAGAVISEQRLSAYPDNLRVRAILSGLYSLLGKRDRFEKEARLIEEGYRLGSDVTPGIESGFVCVGYLVFGQQEAAISFAKRYPEMVASFLSLRATSMLIPHEVEPLRNVPGFGEILDEAATRDAALRKQY
jgi:TolB-like protein